MKLQLAITTAYVLAHSVYIEYTEIQP